nr:hypothetical protein [Tanacetum cinerariifolium]
MTSETAPSKKINETGINKNKPPRFEQDVQEKPHDVDLNELAKLRDDAYENTIIYKERTKKWHDSRLRGDKDFKVGDKVLLYNSHLKMYLGKLKSKWNDLNIVKTIYPYGAVEIIDKNGHNFKINGQRLKKYYEGDIDKENDDVIKFEDGIDDLKRHYGFESGLLRKSVSLGVDISNWEMFDDEWGLEPKEVSPLGEELSLFDRTNEVERGRTLEARRLKSILQQ